MGIIKLYDKSDSFPYLVNDDGFTKQTEFQEVGIYNSELFGKMLFLDQTLQSSEFDERLYHESLVQPAISILSREAENILILGGGEGATARELLKHSFINKVVMVDIDEQLVEICKEYLPDWSNGAFSDSRLEYIAGNAIEYLEKTNEKFDIIISDLTDPVLEGPGNNLCTEEFYTKIVSALKEDGILSIQLGCALRGKNSNSLEFIKRLESTFGNVLPYVCFIPSFLELWNFCLASKSAIDYRDTGKIDENLHWHYNTDTHRLLFENYEIFVKPITGQKS